MDPDHEEPRVINYITHSDVKINDARAIVALFVGLVFAGVSLLGIAVDGLAFALFLCLIVGPIATIFILACKHKRGHFSRAGRIVEGISRGFLWVG